MMTEEQENKICDYICWLQIVGLDETADMIFHSYFDKEWNLRLISGEV